jgi:hypothetical protein
MPLENCHWEIDMAVEWHFLSVPCSPQYAQLTMARAPTPASAWEALVVASKEIQ